METFMLAGLNTQRWFIWSTRGENNLLLSRSNTSFIGLTRLLNNACGWWQYLLFFTKFKGGGEKCNIFVLWSSLQAGKEKRRSGRSWSCLQNMFFFFLFQLFQRAAWCQCRVWRDPAAFQPTARAGAGSPTLHVTDWNNRLCWNLHFVVLRLLMRSQDCLLINVLFYIGTHFGQSPGVWGHVGINP